MKILTYLQTPSLAGVLLTLFPLLLYGQVRITDISPQKDNTTISLNPLIQSVSGKGLCIALSSDGQRVYLGGHSGVWRSDDGGSTWRHPERPQPPAGQTTVTGGLLCPNVYNLLVSPSNKNLVFAATGRDARVPSLSGIYRSTDGAQTWKMVHQFISGTNSPSSVGIVGRITVAPDNPNLIYAAGQYAIAISTDGGVTWVERKPQGTSGLNVYSIVVGPLNGTLRDVYAVGRRVWYSKDGGVTWAVDNAAASLGIVIGSPADGPGSSAIALAIHPSKSKTIYVNSNGKLWRGNFSSFSQTTGAQWKQLPSVFIGYPNTTASGTDYIVTHLGSDGQLYLIASDRRSVNIAVGEPLSTSDWKRIDGGNVHVDPHGLAMTNDFLPPTNAVTSVEFANPKKQELLKDINDKDPIIYADNSNATIERGEAPEPDDLTEAPVPNGFQVKENHNPSTRLKFTVGGSGKIVMVDDGGAYFSTDGAATWQQGKGLSTLGLVNAVVIPISKGLPAICIGTGDNSGFFTKDGGKTWKTQDYVGGDNDACFADPLQSSRLIVFAPRSGNREIFLYTAPSGSTIDGSFGTTQRVRIPGPPPLLGETRAAWNAVSNFFNLGYRPIIQTKPGQRPRPNGDFVTIRFTDDKAVLLRTTAMNSITNTNDWITTATTETSGAKVFQQGPNLPNKGISIVQAAGGHESPTFYVGDPDIQQRLWKWKQGMLQWQLIVPGTISNGAVFPAKARRYFVDPYQSNIIYVLDANSVYRSDNGGTTWVIDNNLQNAITQNGSFPLTIPSDGNPGEALIRDIVFDPNNLGCRFAIGPAGVFYTVDGNHWFHLLLTAAIPMRPNNATFDPCERTLYVSTNNRGLLRFNFLPPYGLGPVGSVLAASGTIKLLRVHDVGTMYGPSSDQLDVEVIVQLNSMGNMAFGFQLRADSNEPDRQGMLDLLRDAFNKNRTIRIEYTRTGCNTGQIIRIIE